MLIYATFEPFRRRTKSLDAILDYIVQGLLSTKEFIAKNKFLVFCIVFSPITIYELSAERM